MGFWIFMLIMDLLIPLTLFTMIGSIVNHISYFAASIPTFTL